jgi:hypothetical protein
VVALLVGQDDLDIVGQAGLLAPLRSTLAHYLDAVGFPGV